jgi:hypothetical protein
MTSGHHHGNAPVTFALHRHGKGSHGKHTLHRRHPLERGNRGGYQGVEPRPGGQMGMMMAAMSVPPSLERRNSRGRDIDGPGSLRY